MHRNLVALSLLGLVAVLAACTAQPVGLSAQRGSTMSIALAGDAFWPGKVSPVGFGGSDFVDVQRGELVFQLDGPGGFELTTRMAVEADASRRSIVGGTTTRQIFVLVDIPVDAPLGSHTLYLVNRLDGIDTPVTPAYQGSIKILEESYDVPLAGGGTETVTGTSTPLKYWGSLNGVLGWHPMTPAYGVPQPAFKVTLSKVSGTSGDNRRASTLVAQLTFPDAEVDLLRVVPVAHMGDHYWISTNAGGVATINGVGLTSSALGGFLVVFQNTSSAPVSASQFQLSLVDATDQFGSSGIVNDWSLALNQGAIE